MLTVQQLATSFFSLLLFLSQHSLAIPSKCSACRCVAEELQERLENEQPRNHLDLRHRLDPQGNRWGKVISYKVSELRVVELLDTLCDAMKGFELAYVNITGTSTWEWVKKGSTVIDEKFKVPRAEAKEREKEIAHYCGSLIEEYEEELSDFIQKPDPEGPSLTNLLCSTLTKACSAPKKAKPSKRSEEL